jgi:hypothetical protein
VNYDTIPYRADGQTYTVFLCKRCSRAWKLRHPVEAWKVKSLINHFTSHKTDTDLDAKYGKPPSRAAARAALEMFEGEN